jgi:hypothetical protein
MGVTVKRAAQPHELTAILRKFKAVTLVTHWRFTRLLPEDIVDDSVLLRALISPKGRVQQAISRTVSECDPGLLEDEAASNVHDHPLRERLATVLNSIAAASHALYKEPSDTLPSDGNGASARLIERLTRTELEQAFPGLIAFGRSVEFSDGMRSVQEVVNAIPEDFNGTLDLTTCNSVILGKAIKASHPNCLVAMNRYPTALHVRLPLYKLVIEDLARHPVSFADALMRFHTN